MVELAQTNQTNQGAQESDSPDEWFKGPISAVLLVELPQLVTVAACGQTLMLHRQKESGE